MQIGIQAGFNQSKLVKCTVISLLVAIYFNNILAKITPQILASQLDLKLVLIFYAFENAGAENVNSFISV